MTGWREQNTGVNALYRALALLIAASFSSTASASHFDFCWLSGVVESVGEKSGDEQSFTMRVSSALPARSGILSSTSPESCASYVGKAVDAGLKQPQELQIGSEIDLIQRVWIDVKGQWWVAWESTEGWEVDDGEDGARNLDDLIE